MIPSTTNHNIPVPDPQAQAATTRLPTAASYLILFQCLDYILHILAGAIRGGIVALAPHIRLVCAYCYDRAAFLEEHLNVMPGSALAFVIRVLLVIAEIKAQYQPGFPFTTHPLLIRFSVISVLSYGSACAMLVVVSATGLDRTCAFAIIVRLGKMGSLCILVVSLAGLFYL